MQKQVHDHPCNAALRIALCCSISEEIAVVLRCSALYEAILNALGNAIDLGQCGAHEEEVTQKIEERIFLRESSRIRLLKISEYGGHDALAEWFPRGACCGEHLTDGGGACNAGMEMYVAMLRRSPTNADRDDLRCENMQGTQILDGEDVVRRTQHLFGEYRICRQCARECSCVRVTLVHMLAQASLNGLCINSCRRIDEWREFCCLHAKGKVTDNAEAGEERNASARKVLCTAAGKDEGELEYEIRATLHSMTRARPFIEDGRRTALGEAAAHSDDDICGGIFPTYGFHLKAVAIVKRIVFGDDANNSHSIPPHIHFLYILSVISQKNKVCVGLSNKYKFLCFQCVNAILNAHLYEIILYWRER